MTDTNAVTLVARFQDSREARALGPPAEVRRAALLLVETSFGDLGAHPRLLDADQLRELVFDRVARRIGGKDTIAEFVPRVLRTFYAWLGEHEMVTHAYELEAVFDDADSEFVSRVRSVKDGERIAGDVKPIVGRGTKVGRNDPCPCASGKKFKQCCGKNG
ncbi:MAG: SEC-C domain-containing protein [Planctomycetes bacterium]|nr:SEC-C domain-containing protein [Planctomycetota bacterium]